MKPLKSIVQLFGKSIGPKNLANALGVDIDSKYSSVLLILGGKLKIHGERNAVDPNIKDSLWDLWFWTVQISILGGKMAQKELAILGALNLPQLNKENLYTYEIQDDVKAREAEILLKELPLALIPLVSREVLTEERYRALPREIPRVTSPTLLANEVNECLVTIMTKYDFSHISNRELEVFIGWIVESFVEVMVLTDGEPRSSRLSHRGALRDLVVQLVLWMFARNDK